MQMPWARNAIIAMLCVSLAAAARANGIPREMLAIASLTLAAGSKVEGVMSVCRIDARANPTDGLYTVWTDERGRASVRVSLFDNSFKWRHPGSRAPRKHGRDEALTVYFLRDVSKTYISVPGDGRAYVDESTTVEENGVRVLLRDRSLHTRYELLDYVPIHLRRPAGGRPLGRPEGYRGAARTALQSTHAPNQVPLADVVAIELLREPSDSWGRAIAVVMKEWWDAYDDDTGDTVPPVWYHENCGAEGQNWRLRPWRGWP